MSNEQKNRQFCHENKINEFNEAQGTEPCWSPIHKGQQQYW